MCLVLLILLATHQLLSFPLPERVVRWDASLQRVRQSDFGLLNQTSDLSLVCLLIPITSSKQDWKVLEHAFVYRMPLLSLAKTCEPDNDLYTVFIGYDVGDSFFDKPATLAALHRWSVKNLPVVAVKTTVFGNELGKPGPMMNFLSREAYKDNSDFIYRINDDTELLTKWTYGVCRHT